MFAYFNRSHRSKYEETVVQKPVKCGRNCHDQTADWWVPGVGRLPLSIS